MARKATPSPGGIPESLKSAVPAKRRTAAFSSSDPAVRERLGPPDGAVVVAGRFQLKARGAGMEVHDLETARRVPFPKGATGVVRDVLAGLFGEQEAAAPPVEEREEAPPRLEDAELGLVLERCEVRVDPLHPAQIARSKAKNALRVEAYAVSIDGRPFGHILLSGPTRFQVAVPELQAKTTAHTNLNAAFQRVRTVAETYRRRLLPDTVNG